MASAAARRFGAILATVLAGMAVGCSGGSEPAVQLDTVRLVIQRRLSNLPLLLADGTGAFERRGIRIDRVPLGQGSEALPLLIRSDVDAAAMATAINFLSAVHRGAELRVVASKGTYLAGHCSQTALVARLGWTPPADPERLREFVRGSRIAITNSIGVTRFLAATLASVDLSQDDVELQILPDQAKLDALRTGRVDLVRIGEPHISRLAAQGHVVWKTPEEILTDEDFSYIVFSRRLALEDRDLGRRFLEAYLEGIETFLEGKTEENLALASRETGIDPDALRAACWPAVRRSAEVDLETLRRVGAWAVGRGYLDEAPEPGGYVDSTLLEEALEARGGSRQGKMAGEG